MSDDDKGNVKNLDDLRKMLEEPSYKRTNHLSLESGKHEADIIDNATEVTSEQYALAGYRAKIAAMQAGLPKDGVRAASATAIGTLAGLTMQKGLSH